MRVPSGSVPTEIIVNRRPKGFGANHNAAFLRCRTPFFCVANPDIRLAGPVIVDQARLAQVAERVGTPLGDKKGSETWPA